uniref:Uncharacterized protein n=1 Tax=Anopheles merus TaxID=30066 RepID=A0A182V2N8_ANOME
MAAAIAMAKVRDSVEGLGRRHRQDRGPRLPSHQGDRMGSGAHSRRRAKVQTLYTIWCCTGLQELQAGGHSIQSTETLKYLGVDLCRKQHHSRHLERVVNKASRITNALMPDAK